MRTTVASRSSTARTAALVLVSVLGLTDDERLVHFDDADELPELGIHQGGANLVAHIQRGFVAAETHVTLNLQAADALLASQHQVHDAEPLAQAFVCVLENGVDQYRKAVVRLFSAKRAMPVKRHRGVRLHVDVVAAGAAHAIRPTLSDQIRLAGIVIGEHGLKLAYGHLVNLRAGRHVYAPVSIVGAS